MSKSILTAKVKTIEFGLRTFEGLMFEDGSFGIGVVQLNEQLLRFSTSSNTASRDLKRLLGNTFSPSKVKVEGVKQLLNAIKLPELEKVITELARKKNQAAIELTIDLVGLSLYQIFCDGFDIELKKEDRQIYNTKRNLGKETRKDFVCAFKYYLTSVDGCTEEDANKQIAMFTNQIYDSHFKKHAFELKREYGVKDGELLRDYFSVDDIGKIQGYEEAALNQLVTFNKSPQDAINHAIDTFGDGSRLFLMNLFDF